MSVVSQNWLCITFNMKTTLKIRPLKEKDFADLNKYFGPKSEFKKPWSRWVKYLNDARAGKRLVLVAEVNKHVIAFCTLNFKSPYLPFRHSRIPEIQDLNVAKAFRRQGIARQIILHLEKILRKKSYRTIGIGVGMEPGYGQAQRLYIKMGYVPDGRGLTYKCHPVVYGKRYPADDDLVLYFTKEI